MTAIVRPGDVVVFVGDSITQAGWMSVAGGLIDQINEQFPEVNLPRPGFVPDGAYDAVLAPGSAPARVRAVITQPRINTVNSGIAGNQTSDIEAAVAARITDYNPDVVVLLVGINDITFGVPLGTSTTNYDSILSQIRAWSPTVGIVCLSVLCYGEQWTTGPAWDNTPTYDALIDAFNTMVRGLCVTYDATFIDIRADFLLYEATFNTPMPGLAQGVLTSDRFHPNATGQLKMGDYSIPFFSVVP